MAALKIITGVSAGDKADEVPRHQWRELVRTRRTHCNLNFREDCRALVFFIEDGATNGWLDFGDRETYIREGLGLELDLVQWAIDGLRRLEGVDAVPFDEAVVLGKRGGDRKSEKAKADQGNNVTLINERGNNPTYALARLKRDRPDLAALVISGAISAHAAAISAGFRKATWSAPTDVDLLAEAIASKYPGWILVKR